MSEIMLKQLIGIAVLDRGFCDGLMNGRRCGLLAEFDLTEEEREIVESSNAESVRGFAGRVHGWLRRQERPLSARSDV
ncbi:MAG: hypothetical protein PVF54_01620 [Anaerolineae bacterium]|jgi:hypothetical protein